MKTTSEQLIEMATEAMKAIDEAEITSTASVKAVKWSKNKINEDWSNGKVHEIHIDFENDKHSRQVWLMSYFKPEVNRKTLDEALAAIKANDMDAFIKVSGIF